MNVVMIIIGALALIAIPIFAAIQLVLLLIISVNELIKHIKDNF